MTKKTTNMLLQIGDVRKIDNNSKVKIFAVKTSEILEGTIKFKKIKILKVRTTKMMKNVPVMKKIPLMNLGNNNNSTALIQINRTSNKEGDSNRLIQMRMKKKVTVVKVKKVRKKMTQKQMVMRIQPIIDFQVIDNLRRTVTTVIWNKP